MPSRSPVELARQVIASDECLECREYGNSRMEELARALLAADSAFEEIRRHPENAGKVAGFALSVLRGSE